MVAKVLNGCILTEAGARIASANDERGGFCRLTPAKNGGSNLTLSLRMAAFLALCVSPCFAGTAGTLLITEQNGALSVSFQLAGSDFSGSGPGGTYNAAIGFDDGTNEWTAGPSYYDVLDGNYVYEAIYGVAWADPGDPGQFNILNISISGSGDTYFNFAHRWAALRRIPGMDFRRVAWTA